jgi:predicted PurR-regulated permease PerM
LIAIGLGGVTVAACGLWALQSIAAPVLISLVLVICVNPIRSRLERHGVPRSIATGSVIGVTFILLAAFAGALIVALAQFVTLLPQFTAELQGLADQIAAFLGKLGIGSEQVQALVRGFDPGEIVSFATDLLGGAANLIFGLVIVLTTLLLAAMDAAYGPVLMRQLHTRHSDLVFAIRRFTRGVRRYMLATTGLGIAQGIINWAALFVLQVPGAFLWGLLSFLCSFIPNIGYFIAIIPPLIFGLLSGGWPTVIGVLVVYGLVKAVIQSLIQPKVVGTAVSLNQTITFVSVLVWTLVLGPVGAILAIPLTLLVRAIFIDADPRAAWWRPLTGDLEHAKAVMRAEDSTRKSERRKRKSTTAPQHSDGANADDSRGKQA